MSRYYAYLNNVDKDSIITADYWNALVGQEQATEDLLIGSMYPWATVTSAANSTSPATFWVQNNTTSWIRYYETAGIFTNPNNPSLTQITRVSGTYNFTAHKILVPGLYAWNIAWGEEYQGAQNDQMIGVKVRKMTDAQLAGDPELSTVVGEYRAMTTSWAHADTAGPTVNRYNIQSTSFGMGYPLRSYSGMHFFNAPPYGQGYEYVLFQFTSSIITSGVPNIYWSRMIGPNITFMKVR